MSKGILIIFLNIIFQISVLGQNLERIEPPFWWAGMNSTELQLMLYGNEIGELDIELIDTEVELKDVHRTDNNNYLFVDLIISEDVKPGAFQIHLKRGKRVIKKLQYHLNPRSKEQKNRPKISPADVIYLITPDRFANGDPSNDNVNGMRELLQRDKEYGRHGGDLKGIENHLDYLDDLGFTAIWLNPVLENDQEKWSYHGYSTTDYFKVDPRFGTNEDYVNMIRKANEKGIGVIMDIIVNHCGSMHWWMSDPPFANWVNYQDQPYQQTNHRKYTLLDPYTSSIDRKIMTEGWFVPTMPDLNQRNPFMSKYLIQNSIWWIEYSGIAGIRQDTYSYPFREFMTDWTCAIRSEYPDFFIVGEEWVDDPAIISYWQEGKVNQDGYTSCLPSVMDFPLCFALHKSMNEDDAQWGNGLIKLYEKLGQDFNYSDPSQLIIFPDNHDMSRIFTQVNEDFDLYKMALTYILTTRGIPQLYYGTEIVMSNKGTDSHGIIRSDFPGGWAGDEVNIKNGKNLSEMQQKALYFNKMLMNWRKKTTVVHNGSLMHFEPQNGVYTYFRYNDDEAVMIILNKNKESSSLSLNRFEERLKGYTSGTDLFSESTFDLEEAITLEPMRPYILTLHKG